MKDPADEAAEPAFGDHEACTYEQIVRLGRRLSAVPVPTLFELVRVSDLGGVSGRGHVAHGVIFPGIGGAVYQWHQQTPPFGWPAPIRQYGLFDSIADVIAVHGHQGGTIVSTSDPGEAHAEVIAHPEAFAVQDQSGDIPEWGVWLPGTDQAVTWAPALTPISGRRQADRHTRWRSFGEMQTRVAARTGPGRGRVVFLSTRQGRLILHQVRGAYVAGMQHARVMRDRAMSMFDSLPLDGDALIRKLGAPSA